MAEQISATTRQLFDQYAPQDKSITVNKELNKDSFLRLMMEQMKSQNPLSPNGGYQEMAAQLAQYTQVEQLTNLNSTMGKLLEMNGSLATSISQSTLPAMIGKSVRANANALYFDGSKPTSFGYNLPVPAQELSVDIKDSSGKVVRSLRAPNISTRSGENTLFWDGKTGDGTTVSPGNYTFSMSGKDSSGNDIVITPEITGKISGVRYRENGAVAIINGAEVPINSITELKE